MFNVGGPEIVVILLVALIVLGPDQLPKAMRTFGNVMAEIRKVSGGFQAEMRKAMDTIEAHGSDTPSTSSASPSADGVHRPLASTPEEADVTETVARNPHPDPERTLTEAAPSVVPTDVVDLGPMTEDDPPRAWPSAEDRAAG